MHQLTFENMGLKARFTRSYPVLYGRV